ncbi:MAG: hypothetical protein V3581_04575, partial [Candidatus Cardinium sp.]
LMDDFNIVSIKLPENIKDLAEYFQIYTATDFQIFLDQEISKTKCLNPIQLASKVKELEEDTILGRPAAPDHNYCLTKFAFNCFLQFCDVTKFQFHSINFTSLRHSIRVNPIAPRYILNRAYLEEYTRPVCYYIT